MSQNPYSTPEAMQPSGTRDDALRKVSMPATLLLVTGILSLLGAVAVGLMPVFIPQFLEGMLTQMANDPNFPAEEREQLETQLQSFQTMGLVYYVQAIVGFVGAIVMILGALKMRNLEGYAMSMAGCISAICPFTSPCCGCLFPVAIGIWGIVLLANQDIKVHFK